MTKKVGRNDPCPCGSGKKYKQCCMLKEQESVSSAKYTASGKRKFKAKVIKMGDQSLSVFNRSATMPQEVSTSETLEKLKFKNTDTDFRVKEEEGPVFERGEEPSKEASSEEKKTKKPDEFFKETSEDFRKKSEDES